MIARKGEGHGRCSNSHQNTKSLFRCSLFAIPLRSVKIPTLIVPPLARSAADLQPLAVAKRDSSIEIPNLVQPKLLIKGKSNDLAAPQVSVYLLVLNGATKYLVEPWHVLYILYVITLCTNREYGPDSAILECHTCWLQVDAQQEPPRGLRECSSS